MREMLDKLLKFAIICVVAYVIAYFTGHAETFKAALKSFGRSANETLVDIHREAKRIDTQKIKAQAIKLQENATKVLKKEADEATKKIKEEAAKLKNKAMSNDDKDEEKDDERESKDETKNDENE